MNKYLTNAYSILHLCKENNDTYVTVLLRYAQEIYTKVGYCLMGKKLEQEKRSFEIRDHSLPAPP